ncbi:MAG: PDC sensor domain-containing protein [Rhodocyclaceae bacterium]|nr:PDC sensor domain-containing protein [Rhodocyclaceae bacterium]MDZ4216474.1 PDC sensor domain-containing protein [Rhodocyclaceae bacterium]
MARLAERCPAAWGDRQQLNTLLQTHFAEVPYVEYLYVLDRKGVQICDNIAAERIFTDYFGRDRSQRPYLREPVPPWGFLLSDAYVSMTGRPSLTALHVIKDGEILLGYLGADFDVRQLPTGGAAHEESRDWRQIKGDPSIRGTVFLQERSESQLDRHLEKSLSILEDLMTDRGLFQVVIHFSSSRATTWFMGDPYRYRLLDAEALNDPDICLIYPHQPWPADATMPQEAIKPILAAMRELRLTDRTIYLRSASINIFNGMVSLTFSCDGSHYLSYTDFLDRNSGFWSGIGG